MAEFMSKRERERRARERAEREKREREAREKAEREAREKAEREARERAEREQREREERERKEREDREAREREEQAQNPPVQPPQPQPPQVPKHGSGQFGLMVFNEDGTLRDKVDSVFARCLHKEYLTPLQLGRYVNGQPVIPENVKGSFVVEGLGSLPNGYRPFHFICSSGNTGSGYWWPEVRIEGKTVYWSYEYGCNTDSITASMFFESTTSLGGDCFLVIGVCPDV